MAFRIEAVSDEDRRWVDRLWQTHWGGTTMAVHGEVFAVQDLPGFRAVADDGAMVGLLTYRRVPDALEFEVLSLNSLREGIGIGRALLQRLMDQARDEHLSRVWLITTNEKVDPLRFYQRIGFRLVRVHLDAVTRARRLKPSIPEHGDDGVPLRDEWELEWRPEVPKLV